MIGFACKYFHPDRSLKKKLLEETERSYNGRAVTLTWLRNQTTKVAEQRLLDITKDNLLAARKLVTYVSKLPEPLRMLRLSSDILPAYTAPGWAYFYLDQQVHRLLEQEFAKIGDIARNAGVRLSFHPGQFCVLASDNPDIVDSSIDEFEYHVDMARWMGYGKRFQDFKINVHISGRNGPDGIRSALQRMTPEARNCITIENDENSWGVEHSLELQNDCALVLDIHHAWCREGVYIQPNSDDFKRIVDSWRGVRPVIHYSYSRDEHLAAGGYTSHTGLPDRDTLIQAGAKKAKLRAHSDTYPNDDVNNYAFTFHDQADIMCEAKFKQLASIDFYNAMTGNNIPWRAE